MSLVEGPSQKSFRLLAFPFIQSATFDILFAFRLLTRSWVSTLAAILTLAIGVGSTTAVFSLMYGILWRPLPYPDSESIVVIARAFASEKAQPEMTAIKYRAIRQEAHTLSAVVAVLGGQRATWLNGNNPERILQRPVSADFFAVLGVEPSLGRAFLTSEEQVGTERAAILGNDFWRLHFDASTEVLGQELKLDGESYHVVGVAPPGMDEFLASDVWTTFDVAGHPLGAADNYLVLGRLASGKKRTEAQADLALVAEQTRRQYPGTMASDELLEVRGLREELTTESRRGLFLLMAAVSLVLLIACANVANLQMATLAARRGELAVRSALGASGLRLLRQLLTESLCLSLAGSLLGVGLAQLLLRLTISLRLTDLPRLEAVTIDVRILGFAFLLALLTTLIFGTIPAWNLGRLDIQGKIREGGGRSGSGRERFGSTLLIGELALCMVLLVASTLLLQSLRRLSSTDTGFAVERLSSYQLALSGPRYSASPAVSDLSEELLLQLRQLPRVESATLCFCQPLGRSLRLPLHSVDGHPKPADRYLGQIYWMPVSPSFFETLEIPLRSGRVFESADRNSSMPVAIVNEAFAAKFLEIDDAVGKKLLLGWEMLGPEYGDDWRQIVGVVGDIRESGLRSEPQPTVFVPLGQMSAPVLGVAEKLPANFLLRTPGGKMIARNDVQALVSRQDANLPVEKAQTLVSVMGDSMREERFQTTLLGAFAFTGLLLVMIGVYGMVSFSVLRRTQEIGIRMAVGASPQRISRWILGRALRLTLWALLLGAPAALVLVRFLESLLFGFTIGDWWVFPAVPLLLGALTLLASYFPARKAASIQVSEALGLQ